MGLPLIQMETISRSTGKFPKASQGGLTSPKLYDSGLDFPNRGRKKHRRTAGPNQLPICHTSRFVESQVLQKCFRESLQECHCCRNVCQVWQKCFTESVAEMSLWQECHTSRFVGCQVANLSLLQKCHTWVRIGPIAPESPPSDGKAHPSDGKAQTPRRKSGTPRWKRSTLRWKMT
jgi:hypothetical protein